MCGNGNFKYRMDTKRTEKTEYIPNKFVKYVYTVESSFKPAYFNSQNGFVYRRLYVCIDAE